MIQRIIRSVVGIIGSVVYRLIDLLGSSESSRSLLYNIKNRLYFSSLGTHERMIADKIRLDFYHDGIKRYIMPGDTVVDLGTGTGILSFLAAQRNPKKIYAIDQSEIIKIARQIAQQNNIKNITFVQTNSHNFKPNEKLDIILHEQIGSFLFDENLVKNILDLKKRLLKGTGKILPGKFELFLEPVCLKKGYRTPYIWENDICNIDFRFLKDIEEINRYTRGDYYKKMYIEHGAVDYFLCQPEPCLSFDLNELNDENELPKFIGASKRVVLPGPMDGICLYFRVAFDVEIALDNSPLHTRTNWMNVLFRTESKRYAIGELISFRLTMDALSNRDSWSLEVYPLSG